MLIISEENKRIDYNIRQKYQMCWLIDPIDGTKEFVKKNGQFTINIGLCDKGVPIFGIVSIPVTGEIYYGISGIGSFKIHNNVKTKLQILNDVTKEFLKLFENPNIIQAGSSIKLLLIAEGKADIYPRLGPTSEWDTCAAHAIVKYAGGKVFKYKNIDLQLLTEELVYNKKNIINPYFIVY
jgi:3'(2'), 5'-bisphosphate nucleotidase